MATERQAMEATKRRSMRRTSASKLTDDLVVEILSRLPAKSFCRSKCVCKAWLAFASDPHYRTRLPQPLAGLFYPTSGFEHEVFRSSARFLPLSPSSSSSSPAAAAGIDTDLAFLPSHDDLILLESCNGLLLCSCRRPAAPHSKCVLYVCNPAIRRWMALPDYVSESSKFAMAYDPRASPEKFHVLHFQLEYNPEENKLIITGLEVFSSQTAAWSKSPIQWGLETCIEVAKCCVFLNGMVHLLTENVGVLTVDPEGRERRVIQLPESLQHSEASGCIGDSQGYLHYAGSVEEEEVLQIWVLADYNREIWELRHRIRVDNILGNDSFILCNIYQMMFGVKYVSLLHPERDVVYLLKNDSMLLSCNLNTGDVNELCNLSRESLVPRFFPYTPCYANCFSPDEQVA